MERKDRGITEPTLAETERERIEKAIDQLRNEHLEREQAPFGMTLRDYFAGQAMMTIGNLWICEGGDPKSLAENCFRLADAMLQARSKSDD